MLRLTPLLFVAFAAVATQSIVQGKLNEFVVQHLLAGFICPTWPDGAWSVTVEIHFYLLLPLILKLDTGGPRYLPLLIVGALLLRAALWIATREVRFLAYWTILGRIDQFLLGILVLRVVERIQGQHGLMLIATGFFCAFYASFTGQGGWYGTETSPIWIVLPTIEGFYFALLIAWYDNLHVPQCILVRCLSRAAGMVGACSFSIYLLHNFVVSVGKKGNTGH